MINRLFLFNPECELAIANESKYYMAPANIVRMADDLAFLPAYMSANGDAVLVNRCSGAEFIIKQAKILGIDCREMLRNGPDNPEVWQLEPWGWSPKVCHDFVGMPGVKTWTSEMKELYSRKKAKVCLERLIPELPFVESICVPSVCSSVEEIEVCITTGKHIVKAPWSSSGKGLLSVDSRLSVKEKEWLTGILRKQGYVMVEKRLDKVFDFAMEFCSDGVSKVGFVGWSEFYTGEKGEYRGNYVGPQRKIEEKITEYVGEEVIRLLKERIVHTLSRLLSSDYHGYFGVDMMVYCDGGGQCRIQPCLEINLRYNMGVIAWFLSQRYLADKTDGIFSIHFFPKAGEALQEHIRKQESYPLLYKNNRILSGYLNLTPIGPDTCFVAELICSYL